MGAEAWSPGDVGEGKGPDLEPCCCLSGSSHSEFCSTGIKRQH